MVSPRVRRDEYIVLDRHYLGYLNIIEKANCYFCGYFNGLLAYVQEVAARTEQCWCPIKNACKVGSFRGHYDKFFDFGDAVSYRESFEGLRRNFDDVHGDIKMNIQQRSEYEEIRQQLLAKRSELQRRIEEIGKSIGHAESPVSADFAEQAVERENDEVQDALGDEAQKELKLIDAALKRMDKNEYGVCMECGDAIPLDRLRALPYADHCVKCAE